jgi:hypothetical protein
MLLNSLSNQGFSFSKVESFISGHRGKVIALRHDVDTSPENSLQFATIEAERGIKGTYYFRMMPASYDEKIIKVINSLGHEIGYHYEDLSFAWAKLRARSSGLRAQGEEREKLVVELGIKLFIENLEKLRKLAPVSTICMHGSPMSRWDSRLLWKYYDYRDFGIKGEPYFDINFEEVLYLTDTGRRWDGEAVSVRDRAQGARVRRSYPEHVEGSEGGGHRAKGKETRSPFPKFHSTFDIIKAADSGHLPDKIMMTFHPQRWTGKPIPWVKELVWQNMKNQVKYLLLKLRNE